MFGWTRKKGEEDKVTVVTPPEPEVENEEISEENPKEKRPPIKGRIPFRDGEGYDECPVDANGVFVHPGRLLLTKTMESLLETTTENVVVSGEIDDPDGVWAAVIRDFDYQDGYCTLLNRLRDPEQKYWGVTMIYTGQDYRMDILDKIIIAGDPRSTTDPRTTDNEWYYGIPTHYEGYKFIFGCRYKDWWVGSTPYHGLVFIRDVATIREREEHARRKKSLETNPPVETPDDNQDFLFYGAGGIPIHRGDFVIDVLTGQISRVTKAHDGHVYLGYGGENKKLYKLDGIKTPLSRQVPFLHREDYRESWDLDKEIPCDKGVYDVLWINPNGEYALVQLLYGHARVPMDYLTVPLSELKGE